MTFDELKALAIRDATLVDSNYGCLLACDPAKEEESPHANLVVVQGQKLATSWVKFNAHSICAITSPTTAILVVSADGLYAMFSKSVKTGNIFHSPMAGGPHFGSIRSVASIAGVAYAVGLRATVFRLDDQSQWIWLGQGLPGSSNFEAIDGKGNDDIYAVGSKGAIWHFDGKEWSQEHVPTNSNFTSVVHAPDGSVYIAGHAGTLIMGSKGRWELLEQENVREDIWGLAWFSGKLFVSTFLGVYQLAGARLVPIDFGNIQPTTTYKLTSTKELLWSIGENDIVAFDGHDWHRVV